MQYFQKNLIQILQVLGLLEFIDVQNVFTLLLHLDRKTCWILENFLLLLLKGIPETDLASYTVHLILTLDCVSN